MKEPVVMSWSGGKDSAMALQELLRAGAIVTRNPAKAGRHIVSGGDAIGKLLGIFGMRIQEYRHHP